MAGGRSLTRGTWQRLTGSALDEARLEGLVARFTPGERRAFWAAVLILDGQCTLLQVVEGYAVLDVRPPTAPLPPATPVPPPPLMIPCLHCGEETAESLTGTPRQFCSTRCREAHRAQRRTTRAARGVTARGVTVSDT